MRGWSYKLKPWLRLRAGPLTAEELALIRNPMAKTRKPRTVAFETWKGANGQPVAHLRSGPDIIMWTDSKTRIRSIKRLYEIITTRTPENTRYVELAAPYKPKKKRA